MKLPKRNFKNPKLDNSWLTPLLLSFILSIISVIVSLINFPIVTLVLLTIFGLSRVIYNLFKE